MSNSDKNCMFVVELWICAHELRNVIRPMCSSYYREKQQVISDDGLHMDKQHEVD